MTDHTPASWVLSIPHKDMTTIVVTNEKNQVIALVGKYAGLSAVAEEERVANAALIAAAPDLLEALVALEARAVEMRKLIDPKTWAELEDMATVEIINARAAISKATGDVVVIVDADGKEYPIEEVAR